MRDDGDEEIGGASDGVAEDDAVARRLAILPLEGEDSIAGFGREGAPDFSEREMGARRVGQEKSIELGRWGK